MSLPVVTEKPNSLTEDLDVAGSRGIVRLLRQSDAQVFAGWGPYVGLYDQPTQDTLAGIVDTVQPWFKADFDASQRVKVIMAGAGTSGRLSFFCARSLNPVCEMPTICFVCVLPGLTRILGGRGAGLPCRI